MLLVPQSLENKEKNFRALPRLLLKYLLQRFSLSDLDLIYKVNKVSPCHCGCPPGQAEDVSDGRLQKQRGVIHVGESFYNIWKRFNQNLKCLLPQRCPSVLRQCGCCWPVHMQTDSGKSDGERRLCCCRARASGKGPRHRKKGQSVMDERKEKQWLYSC